MSSDTEEYKELLRLQLSRSIRGEYSAHDHNPYFVVKNSYQSSFRPEDSNQELKLYPNNIPEILLHWAKLDSSKIRNKEDILVVDLETSGLGRGHYAIMIGLGYFEGESFVIEQIFLPYPDSEEHSLERLKELLDSHSLIISFNGKSFDIPLLESRYVYLQMWQNIRALEHLDLLHIARRLWKQRLASCALESLEYYILGQMRDADSDIEGRFIPDSYLDYLRYGDTHNIARIFKHNELDILHTMALFSLICEVCTYPPAQYDYRIDYLALALLYLSQKRPDEAQHILQGYLEEGYHDPAATYELGMLYKRAGDLMRAKECFAEAADCEYKAAMLEYAKILEREKDFEQAAELCDTLLIRERGCWDANPRKIEELEHRAKRLHQKLGKAKPTAGKETPAAPAG